MRCAESCIGPMRDIIGYERKEVVAIALFGSGESLIIDHQLKGTNFKSIYDSRE